MADKDNRLVTDIDEESEYCCFRCKDGGKLRMCDYRECVKSYHPSCVKKDDSFLKSDARWICDLHRCFRCRKYSEFHCYTCPTAVCECCFTSSGFLKVKWKNGFCERCLKLVFLIEENKEYSDGVKVDFNDFETYEALYKWYYLMVKEKEGFHLSDICPAQDQAMIVRSESDYMSYEKENRSHFKGETSKEPHSPIASIVLENMKRIYLKRTLLYQLLRTPEWFEDKVIGSFVRVRSDQRFRYLGSHQLMQVKGLYRVFNNENQMEIILKVAPPEIEIRLSQLSDGDMLEEECEDLKREVSTGLIDMPTEMEFKWKAKLLHEEKLKQIRNRRRS